MPTLKVMKAAVAELPIGPPLVIAISGGTTGIGSYIADAFASIYAAHGSKLRIYIIGRNAARAGAVLSRGRIASPGSDWHFVQATDLSLLSEIDQCCQKIIELEKKAPFAGGPPRLDLLYMTHSFSAVQANAIRSNSEGLDTFFSTLYYSRIRLITELAPLLEATPQQSHVVSVYAGSFEEVSANENPPIGCPTVEAYGINVVRKHVVFMKNFMFEEFASKYAGKISFIHIYPGLVDGPGFYHPDNPLWFKVIWRVLYPFLWLTYMTQPATCGQVMAYLATSSFPAKGSTEQNGVDLAIATTGVKGDGSYAVGQRADAGNKQGSKTFEAFRDKDLGKEVCDYTIEVLERVRKPAASAD